VAIGETVGARYRLSLFALVRVVGALSALSFVPLVFALGSWSALSVRGSFVPLSLVLLARVRVPLVVGSRVRVARSLVWLVCRSCGSLSALVCRSRGPAARAALGSWFVWLSFVFVRSRGSRGALVRGRRSWLSRVFSVRSRLSLSCGALSLVLVARGRLSLALARGAALVLSRGSWLSLMALTQQLVPLVPLVPLVLVLPKN
jgi:hypothetical protein